MGESGPILPGLRKVTAKVVLWDEMVATEAVRPGPE